MRVSVFFKLIVNVSLPSFSAKLVVCCLTDVKKKPSLPVGLERQRKLVIVRLNWSRVQRVLQPLEPVNV